MGVVKWFRGWLSFDNLGPLGVWSGRPLSPSLMFDRTTAFDVESFAAVALPEGHVTRDRLTFPHTSSQVKGFGTRLMNQTKEFARTRDRLSHFLTYADNNAVGYFAKQGEGGSTAHCRLHHASCLREVSVACLDSLHGAFITAFITASSPSPLRSHLRRLHKGDHI